MKKFLIIFSISLAASTSTFAGNSADLSVAGRIAPSACDVTLANAGVFDFGTMRAGDLYLNQPTNLYQTSDYAFSCAAPTLLAFKLTDNRPKGSAPFSCQRYLGVDATTCNFGVGEVNGLQLGAYALKMNSYRQLYTQSINSGGSWRYVDNGSVVSTAAWYAFAKGGKDIPDVVSQDSGSIRVALELNPVSAISPITNEIPLDGSATIELIYL